MGKKVTRKEINEIKELLRASDDAICELQAKGVALAASNASLTIAVDSMSHLANTMRLGSLAEELKELGYRFEKKIRDQTTVYKVPLSYNPSGALRKMNGTPAHYKALKAGRIFLAHQSSRKFSMPVLAACMKLRFPALHRDYWPLLKAVNDARKKYGPVPSRKQVHMPTDREVYIPVAAQLTTVELRELKTFLAKSAAPVVGALQVAAAPHVPDTAGNAPQPPLAGGKRRRQ